MLCATRLRPPQWSVLSKRHLLEYCMSLVCSSTSTSWESDECQKRHLRPPYFGPCTPCPQQNPYDVTRAECSSFLAMDCTGNHVEKESILLTEMHAPSGDVFAPSNNTVTAQCRCQRFNGSLFLTGLVMRLAISSVFPNNLGLGVRVHFAPAPQVLSPIVFWRGP